MKSPSVQPEEVSVVIQGPAASEETRLVVESVHRHLPGAEVIVSTWKGEDVSHLGPVDRIVFSEDPGSFPQREGTGDQRALPNNVNRQIVSTKAGIALASRPHVLKLRSDIVLTGANGFIDVFGVFACFEPPLRHVKQRLVGNASGSANPDLFNYCFHPGDFLFFGRRSDVAGFFDLPLYRDPRSIGDVIEERRLAGEPVQYLKDTTPEELRLWTSEFCPEVYLFRTYLLTRGVPLDRFSTFLDYSEEWRRMSQDYLINQFVLLDDDQLGIRCLKHPGYERENYRTSIDFESWWELYRERFRPSQAERTIAGRLSERQAGRGLVRRLKRQELGVSRGARLPLLELRAWSLVLRLAKTLLPPSTWKEEVLLLRKQVTRYLKFRALVRRQEM